MTDTHEIKLLWRWSYPRVTPFEVTITMHRDTSQDYPDYVFQGELGCIKIVERHSNKIQWKRADGAQQEFYVRVIVPPELEPGDFYEHSVTADGVTLDEAIENLMSKFDAISKWVSSVTYLNREG